MPIFDELWNSEDKDIQAGGSGLYTARSANFMLKAQNQPDNIITFYGSIGNDERGRYLHQDLFDIGVNVKMETVKDEATSACAILVHNKERTMCCDLAAAKSYSMNHLKENMAPFKNAKIIYTTSYFMFSSYDIMIHALDFAVLNNIPVGFNLSAEYTILCEFDKICKSIEYSDYVFANEHEASAFGQKLGISDLSEIAERIAISSKIN